MLSWIYSALVGLIVGYIARLLLPGADSIGVLATMVVGLAGALLGTSVGQAVGKIEPGDKAGWLWSILGAVLVLIMLRILF